jgi:uncharacterized protein with von Willebrand factor type A (vWA) domain
VAITAVFGWCALQARILVDLVAEKDAHTPGKRPEPNEGRALDTHIATLEEAVAKAEALGEQRCQEAQTAAKRVEGLVAALVEMTSELVEMSKRMAEQTAVTEKVRAELDDYRSRSWWWQHGVG